MMRKTITYSGFVIATIAIIILFITSKNYIQLGIAILLYPPLVYLALKLFPRKTLDEPIITITLPEPVEKEETAAQTKAIEPVEVSDIDKRAFLKIIGAAGLTFFIFNLLGRSGIPFLGKLGKQDPVSLTDTSGKAIDPAQNQPTDGYRIAEVDDNAITFYGFTNQQGAWFIMREDTSNGSFRYTKGGNSFSNSWNRRQNLKYDYYHNVF